MVEEVEMVAKGPRGAFQHSATVTQKAIPIIQVEATEESRVATEMGELNRVLGGGIVPGSLVLIGGDRNREINITITGFRITLK